MFTNCITCKCIFIFCNWIENVKNVECIFFLQQRGATPTILPFYSHTAPARPQQPSVAILFFILFLLFISVLMHILDFIIVFINVFILPCQFLL